MKRGVFQIEIATPTSKAKGILQNLRCGAADELWKQGGRKAETLRSPDCGAAFGDVSELLNARLRLYVFNFLLCAYSEP